MGWGIATGAEFAETPHPLPPLKEGWIKLISSCSKSPFGYIYLAAIFAVWGFVIGEIGSS